MFPLPPSWTHETGLSLETGILELWDIPIPIISGTCTYSVSSSLAPPWAKETGISPRVLHKHLLFRRQATWAETWVEVEVGLIGWDFGDQGACLHHYTSD